MATPVGGGGAEYKRRPWIPRDGKFCPWQQTRKGWAERVVPSFFTYLLKAASVPGGLQGDARECGIPVEHDVVRTRRRCGGRAAFVVAGDKRTAIVAAGGWGGAELHVEVRITGTTADGDLQVGCA